MTFLAQFLRWELLPFSILFCLILVYWITVIAGFLDVEFMDFDLDVEFDLLNLGSVPFSIWTTIFGLQAWLYAFSLNILFSGLPVLSISVVRFIALLIIVVPFTSFTTRFIVIPLKKLFHQKAVSKRDFEKKIIIVTSSQVTGEFGQGEIVVDGTPQILDLRTRDKKPIVKGDKVYIYEYDESEDLFWVIRYE